MFPVSEQVIKTKQEQIRVFPCRSNRASGMGHPCQRCLTYRRTSWEQAELPSVEKEFIFSGGRNIEELALAELKDAGFKVTQQGRDFEMKDQEVTGHIDCFLSVNGSQSVPCEIKGISQFDFDKINSAEDMLKSNRVWIRSYPAQLQLYMLMANCEEGLFYIKNKATFMPKDIWMKLDYAFAESLLKKAETINQHIKNKTLPDRIDDYDVCLKCEFKHICLPDLKQAEGMQIIDNIELEGILNRMEEIKPISKEYSELDEQVKKMLEGKNNYIVGNYLITGKWVEKTMPAKEASQIKYWQKKIVKLS